MFNNNEKFTIVNGFAFADAEEAKQAEKEVEGVAYIRGKTEMNNPQMVIQIYNKMVQQELFETVVGYTYLKELQDYLFSIPYLNKEEILPIPVEHIAPAAENDGDIRQNAKHAANAGGKQKERAWEIRAKVMTGISIVLAVCVIGMFAIQMTVGSVHILNYENAIIDKYEQWEQELNEREAAIRELENNNGVSGQGE